MCLSISRSRPVITTHSGLNRINSQTPVGGPIQLSGGLVRDNKPSSLSSSHTRTHTHTQAYLREVKSEQTRCLQIWSVCKCRLGRRSSACLDGRVWKRETGSCVCFSSSRAHLCTVRRERAHGERGRAGRSEHLSASSQLRRHCCSLSGLRWENSVIFKTCIEQM